MKSIAQRVMIASMGATVATPFLGFALVGLLEGGESSGGPGVGLGMLVLCSVVLVVAYLVAAISGITWATSLWRAGARPTPMQRYWLGLASAYLVAGGVAVAASLA
jgi:hypothetical protein